MSSERKNFAFRLNEALDDAGIPKKGMGRQSALVKLLGVKHRVVKRWLEGDEFPPTSKLVKLANELNVRSNWLLSGQGEKHPSAMAGNGVESEIHKHAGELSQEAFEVAAAWMKLPHLQRHAIRKVIKELAQAD